MRHETVAALIQRKGLVLLCKRSDHRKWHPSVWELPGGHVADESTRDALLRELREELGITADLSDECSLLMETADTSVSLWRVTAWEGEAFNASATEHSAITWVSPAEAQALDLGPLAGHLLTSPEHLY